MALIAFGLAYSTMPSTPRWITPSLTRGAPRRLPVGALAPGHSPAAIIRTNAAARP